MPVRRIRKRRASEVTRPLDPGASRELELRAELRQLEQDRKIRRLRDLERQVEEQRRELAPPAWESDEDGAEFSEYDDQSEVTGAEHLYSQSL